MTHICVSKITTIGSDNGLSPDWHQAIFWTNAGLLSIGPLRTYFNENLIKIQQFSMKKMHMKMSSAKWRPSCLGLNVLISTHYSILETCGRSICLSGKDTTLFRQNHYSRPPVGVQLYSMQTSVAIVNLSGGICFLCGSTNTIQLWSMVFTHWGRDKMDAILQKTVSNAFSWMKMYEFR